ncbi:MAG: PAS domain S-box protein [Syntrophaceae bacterium]
MKKISNNSILKKAGCEKRAKINKRGQAGDSLAGEDIFRNSFDNAAAGMVIADPDRNYLAVNNRFCEITGYSREKLLTMGSRQIVHPDDQAMYFAESGRLVSGESRSFLCDLRFVHADKSIIWVRVQVSAFQGGPDKGARIIAAVEDITRRKRMEEELRKADANLRSVLDSSRDVIYRLNLQTRRYEYVSPSCEAVLGYSADMIMELGAEAILALIHPDDMAEMKAKLASLEVSGKEEAEGRYFKMGEYRWFSNRMFLIRDSSGRPLYRDGTIRDITRRKRAEANLAFVADIQDTLVNLTSFDEIMQSVGAKIGAFLEVSFVFFTEVDPVSNTGRLKYIWRAEGVPRLPDFIRLSDYVRAEFYSALLNGETFIIRDTEADRRNNPEVFRDIRIRSFIIVPFSRYSEWKILLVIADFRPRDWHADDVDLLRDVSSRVFLRLERARAEEALKESEERFRIFMENSPASAWIKDEQGRYVYLSGTYEKSLGVRKEDRLGKTDFDLWPREVAEQFRKNDLAVLAADSAMEMTEEVVNPDGSRHYWWNFKFPLTGPTGLRYIAGIGVNITDRKQAEDALQKSKIEFEDKVRERTAMLEEINKYLLAKIEERKRTKQD